MKRGTVLVAMALLGLPGLASAPAQDAAPKGQETQDRLRDSYRRLLARFRSELQSPDARPWDVAARAEALGSDPAKILEFVRTKIRFEPYPGMQRGPAGVLASGGGNSADKAFLLAELLRARGHKVRMVRTTLKREQAEELARAALAEAKAGPIERLEGPFGSWTSDPERVKAACADAGLASDEFLGLQKHQDRSRAERWNEVLDVTERESGFLRNQFRPAETEPVREIHSDIVQWLRTHYWVQIQAPGGDDWTNLEPVLPKAESEGVVVDPAAVADLFRLMLILDRKVGGKLESVDLLNWEIPIHETLLRSVRFVILPDKGVDDLIRPGKPATEAQMREKIRALRRFQALLMIGSETVGSRPFDLDGGVFDISANGSFMGSTAAGKVRGALDLFDEKTKEKIELLGLRVRFSVTREAATPWVRERPILAEGERDTWCPIVSWALFLQSHDFSTAFVRGLGMWQAVKNQGFIERAMTSSGRASEDIGSPGFSYPFHLLSFARSRQAFLQKRAAGRALGPLWEHSNLFIAGGQVRLGRDGGLCLCEGFDLVENGTLAVEHAGRFALRRDDTCALGVFDTVLEHVLLRGANSAEPTLGTLASFERARILDEEIRLIGAGDALALRGTGLSGRDVAWIGHHALAGERILVARGHAAWWSYEASTGRTVGRTSGGRGGSEVRGDTQPGYIILFENVKTWAPLFGCFVSILATALKGEFTPLDAVLFPACIVAGGLGAAGAASGVTAGVRTAGGAIALLLDMIGWVH